ncbi:transglutaminase-like domain-containing protein, partial [Arthrospira platensis SPKY2]
PAPDLAALSTASSLSPPDPEIVLPLPAEFPESAIATARAVTAQARSGYEQALALQFWFREEFTYSLEAPGGHGLDAIERFLAVRQGFCEQFAASFAALARTLGLPSRVAVGFTPGIPIPPTG